MQHPFGAHTQNFRLRKFRGQLPTGPAGGGETWVVLVKCLLSLSGLLLRPTRVDPPCFSLTRFLNLRCSDKYLTPAHKTTRSSHTCTRACALLSHIQEFSLQLRVCNWKIFFFISHPKTYMYVVGTQKNCLKHPKCMLKLMCKKKVTILCNFLLLYWRYANLKDL